MKRLFVCAVAACLAVGAYSDAEAARKTNSRTPRAGKQVPATPVNARQGRKVTVASRNQDLEPIPESPRGLINTTRVVGRHQEIPAAPQGQTPNYTPADTMAVGVPMFEDVRYVDTHEIAPCAQTKVIVVRDPCQKLNTPECCRRCVAVKICVPTCGCECVKANRNGTRIRYDYGEYAINVRVLHGRVVVNYAD